MTETVKIELNVMKKNRVDKNKITISQRESLMNVLTAVRTGNHEEANKMFSEYVTGKTKSILSEGNGWRIPYDKKRYANDGKDKDGRLQGRSPDSKIFKHYEYLKNYDWKEDRTGNLVYDLNYEKIKAMSQDELVAAKKELAPDLDTYQKDEVGKVINYMNQIYNYTESKKIRAKLDKMSDSQLSTELNRLEKEIESGTRNKYDQEFMTLRAYISRRQDIRDAENGTGDEDDDDNSRYERDGEDMQRARDERDYAKSYTYPDGSRGYD